MWAILAALSFSLSICLNISIVSRQVSRSISLFSFTLFHLSFFSLLLSRRGQGGIPCSPRSGQRVRDAPFVGSGVILARLGSARLAASLRPHPCSRLSGVSLRSASARLARLRLNRYCVASSGVQSLLRVAHLMCVPDCAALLHHQPPS